MIDTDNIVVKLCGEGIEAELQGDSTKALELYKKAWETQKTDYEACIASHYLARMQTTYEDILEWNQKSLDFARKVNDESVYVFLPSLYLNIAKAYEDLNKKSEAQENYKLAKKHIFHLPENDYARMIEESIDNALQRLK